MSRLLIAVALFSGSACSVAGGCWAELDPGGFAARCPIIIRGSIVSVTEAASGQLRADDLATIKVVDIRRNELKDVPLKVGDTFTVRMISRNNTQRTSTDLNYPVGTEAVWLVVLNTKGEFRIDTHPVQKQPIKGMEKLRFDAKRISKEGKKNEPNLDGSMTKGEWIAREIREKERRAKELAAYHATQQEIRDIAKALAEGPKMDQGALRRWQKASLDVRRDVFQLRDGFQPMTGDRLVDVVEFVLRNEPDENVRVFAASCLGYTENWKRAGARAGVVLASALADRSSSVRLFACQALGQRTEKAQVSAIGRLLRDDNAEVRAMAVTTLGRLGTLSVTEANELVPILMQSLVPELARTVENLKKGQKDDNYAEICRLIEKHAGQKLGSDPLAWLDWWQKARADFVGPEVKVERETAQKHYQLYQALAEMKK